MIPTHILADLAPGERVAVLSRGAELRFLVHLDSDDPASIRAMAALEGCDVLETHMIDSDAIRELVQSRERDIGGEG